MRLLLDTHIVLAIIDRELQERYPQWQKLLNATGVELCVSVASIWEIAIKTRLSKLKTQVPPHMIEGYLFDLEIEVLPVYAYHATTELEIDVPTRDPFDRLLIAIAQIENLRFVTDDRALADHPVTFRG